MCPSDKPHVKNKRRSRTRLCSWCAPSQVQEKLSDGLSRVTKTARDDVGFSLRSSAGVPALLVCRASPQHQAQKKMCTCFSSATRDMKPGRNIPVMACSTQNTDTPEESLLHPAGVRKRVSSRVPFAQFHHQWFYERVLAHDPQVTSLHSKESSGQDRWRPTEEYVECLLISVAPHNEKANLNGHQLHPKLY